jgi:hypothetical protein
VRLTTRLRRFANALTLGLYYRHRFARLKTYHRHAQLLRRRRGLPSGDGTAVARRGTFGPVLATLSGFAAMGYSSQSHAISPQVMAQLITQQMKALLQQIIQNYTNKLTNVFGDQTDRTVAATGALGDSINSMSAELFNRELAMATTPSPDACRATDLAKLAEEATANTQESTAIDSVRINAHFGNLTTVESVKARRSHAAKLVHTYGRGAPREAKDRSAEFLAKTQLGASGGNDDPDVEDARAFIENVGGNTLYQTLAIDTSAAGTSAAIPYEMRRATHAARRSVGLQPFLTAMNARLRPTGNAQGSSERDALYREVSRTYGNETWRKEIEEIAHTKPAVVELCKLTATQNKLLLRQNDMLEQSNLTLGAILLEMLEAPDRVAGLEAAFTATGSPTRNQPIPAPSKK